MKFTPAQMTLLHTILAATAGVLMGAFSAGTQFYLSHGQDLWLTLTYFAGTSGVVFASIRVAVWHAIQTSPATPQAEKDTESQALTFAQSVDAKLEAFITHVIPFLHGHSAPAPVPSQPASQGRVSNAVTSIPVQQAITFPQPAASGTQAASVPVPHFDTNASIPAASPPSA